MNEVENLKQNAWGKMYTIIQLETNARKCDVLCNKLRLKNMLHWLHFISKTNVIAEWMQ